MCGILYIKQWSLSMNWVFFTTAVAFVDFYVLSPSTRAYIQ